jgi:TATA-binding related factor (TRF) of subunit 20 of mediator complex
LGNEASSWLSYNITADPNSLFYLTAPHHLSSMSSLIERLQREYNTTNSKPFALEYRLYRSTNPGDDKTSKEARWHHILNLNHIPGKAFRAFEFPNGPESFIISAIPDKDINDYKTLMAQKMATLWTPRSNAAITHGVAFKVGDIDVRVGEVKTEGASQGVKAVLVAIQSLLIDNSTEEDDAVSKNILMEVWKQFGVDGAKEIWGFGNEQKIIKAWCEILRGR